MRIMPVRLQAVRIALILVIIFSSSSVTARGAAKWMRLNPPDSFEIGKWLDRNSITVNSDGRTYFRALEGGGDRPDLTSSVVDKAGVNCAIDCQDDRLWIYSRLYTNVPYSWIGGDKAYISDSIHNLLCGKPQDGRKQ